jgi:hypothetical protein
MVIDSYSKITQNRVQNFNVVWGLLANKNLLIPPTRFAFGDGSGDVQIPVWQITGVLAGVNANISSATDEDGSIVYNFSTLVPTLQTAYNNQDTVWFKFTPDTTKDSIYYLSGAKLTLTDIGYQAKVDWTVAGGAANLIKVDNLQLIILQPLAK